MVDTVLLTTFIIHGNGSTVDTTTTAHFKDRVADPTMSTHNVNKQLNKHVAGMEERAQLLLNDVRAIRKLTDSSGKSKKRRTVHNPISRNPLSSPPGKMNPRSYTQFTTNSNERVVAEVAYSGGTVNVAMWNGSQQVNQENMAPSDGTKAKLTKGEKKEMLQEARRRAREWAAEENTMMSPGGSATKKARTSKSTPTMNTRRMSSKGTNLFLQDNEFF